MTNTGVTLASYSIESKDSSKWNREYTFKPANYEIAADVEYLYVTWSADGWASIKPDSNSNYQAMFNFTISKITVDYLPLQ